MTHRVLFAWIGKTDLNASEGKLGNELGPIGQAVTGRDYTHIILLSNYKKTEEKHFIKWLKVKTSASIIDKHFELSSPTNYKEVYEAVVSTITNVKKKLDSEEFSSTYHISPGTPAMAAVWMIVAKTRFPAELIESSKEHGVSTVSVPFDISADFIPDLLRFSDKKLRDLSEEAAPESPEFADIIYRSRVMKRIIEKATKVAPRSVPVLIEGESGTGKELIARAIHMASPRKEKPFIAVNCGALPSNLVESEVFGHEKGAFTGATARKIGYFEAAHEGTLFFDEIGELPLSAQVKLLRALQTGEITRIGGTKTIKIDVRIIAATNRNLIEEVAAERFRSDLYYRLAVAILKLPPVKERSGDISLLVDGLMEQINKESETEPGYKHKKLSASAKNLLISYQWPGNVREILNTLRRAAIWADNTVINDEDVRDALMPLPVKKDEILHLPLGEGFNIQDVIASAAQHYIKRALEEARGNKTKAAKLVGLPNYQTFTNWMKKYGIEE